MKFWMPTLALFATVSLPAFAQEAPPPDAARPAEMADASVRPSAQQMAAMQQTRQQMMALHEQSRLQMLGSLSSAHRAALANIIGQLAIAPHPDARAAEAQIDALLSGNEKAAVLSAEATERTNSRTLMENARTAMEAAATPDERAKMQARDAERQQRMASRGTQARPAYAPDAGRTLLRIASGEEHGGPGEMHGFDRGPGMMRPQ